MKKLFNRLFNRSTDVSTIQAPVEPVEVPPTPEPVKEAPPVGEPVTKKPKTARKPRKKNTKTVSEAPAVVSNPDKDAATARGEPYVTVVELLVDKNDPSSVSLTLDFNEIFVARLVKAGYRGTTDYEIVDHWFSTLSSSAKNASSD